MTEQTAAAAAGDNGGNQSAADLIKHDWLGEVPKVDAEYAQNKAWKSPRELFDSYRNLEKLVGGDKVPLPKEGDEKAWNELYGKLGRPESPDKYQLGDFKPPEGVEWPQEVQGQMLGEFHKLGLNSRQASGILSAWGNITKAANERMVQEQAAKSAQEIDALKLEFGNAFDDRIESGRRAYRELGLDAEIVDQMEAAMGTGAVLRLFTKLGEKIGNEDRTAQGGSAASGFRSMSPAAAKAQIETLMRDTDFTKRLQAGDSAAKAEWENLHRALAS